MPDINNEGANISQQNIGSNVYNYYGEKKIDKHLRLSPFIPEIFIGREDDLVAVHEKLFSGNNLLLLVNGEGGIGKTTLAAQYYFRYQDEYHHLAWIFAGNNLSDAWLTLATPLGIIFPDTMPAEKRLQELLHALGNLKRPCLLVIDNANDTTELKKNYLALRRCTNFHVLLTTRITEFEQAASHKIKPLEKTRAFELFRKYYTSHQSEEDELLENILAAVGYNTLVIELLAKNLQNFNRLKTKYHLIDLLHDLQEKGLLALSHSSSISTTYNATENAFREESVESIIEGMYELSDLSKEEIAMLSVFAVLPAESILFQTIETLLPESRNLEQTLLALFKKGWLDYNNVHRSFRVSPVIQEITKKKNIGLFQDCRELFRTLIDKLIYEPGTGHFIRVPYEEADLYARYAEAVVHSCKKVDEDIAGICERVGNYHQTKGNLEKALAFYYDFNRLQKELDRDHAENAKFKSDLAVSYSKLGFTHFLLGNSTEALACFQQCNRINKELYKGDPESLEFKNGLAISCENVGDAHARLGNLDKARSFYEERSRLVKELNEAYPKNVPFKHGLANSYSKLGDIHTSLGSFGKAQGFYEEATKLFEQLLKTYPHNVEFANGLAISYEKLGDIQASLGNASKALELYQAETKLFEQLYAAYPQNRSFTRALAISYENIGDTIASFGKFDQSLAFYQKSLRLAKELNKSDPRNVSFKNRLAIAHEKIGKIQMTSGNYEEALINFEIRMKLANELYDADPENVEFKTGLGISYQFLGQTHAFLGNLDKALGFYEAFNRFELELYDANRQSMMAKNGSAISYEKLGEAHASLGNLDKALDFFKKDAHLTKELYDATPQNVEYKNALAYSYTKLGSIYEQKQDRNEAKRFYNYARKLLLELVTAFPAYLEFKQNLLQVEQQLSNL